MGIEAYCDEYVGRLREMLDEISPGQVAQAAAMAAGGPGARQSDLHLRQRGSAVTASHFAVDLAKGTASPKAEIQGDQSQ